MSCNHLSSDSVCLIEVPYSQLILGVKRDKSVCAEGKFAEGCRTGRLDDLLDSSLAKDVDFARSKFAFTSPNSKEGLDWIVG